MYQTRVCLPVTRWLFLTLVHIPFLDKCCIVYSLVFIKRREKKWKQCNTTSIYKKTQLFGYYSSKINSFFLHCIFSWYQVLFYVVQITITFLIFQWMSIANSKELLLAILPHKILLKAERKKKP